MTRAPGRRIATLALAYLLLEWAFAYASDARGLLSAGGHPHLGVLALGAGYLTARVLVHLLGPALVAMEIARFAMKRWMKRWMNAG